MQNEKVSKKIKSSYLVIAIFSKKHSNSKETEMRDSSYYAWSIRRDVGQVLHRQTFPCSSYDALLARGQGPDSAERNPFTSIRDAINTACVE